MNPNLIDDLTRVTAQFEQELLVEVDGIESVDEGCRVLLHLREVLSTLKYADEMLASALGKKMGSPVITEGVTLEAKWSKPTTKWDHERLRSVVSEKIVEAAIDPDTGTINEPPWRLVTKILDYAGVGYWRTGKLKELGLDPNDYREAGAAKVRIEVHGRK